ncbi:MAG: response regulator [Erysipelotrichaceae bacterium]|nr:response regulator [Erysipelotrichaceae bacterium]
MFKFLKEVWSELDRSIFEGKKLEKNLQGIVYVSLIIIVSNIITGIINLRNSYYVPVVASAMFVVQGTLNIYFIKVKQNRDAAINTAMVSIIFIFTFEAINVSHGFPIFWTLLIPLAFCFLANVKAGILLSVYFLILYWVLFYTPLRYTLMSHYSDVVAQRFPILYLANVLLSTFIMTQYHLSMLHQMDYGKSMLKAKEEADKANAAKSDFLANMSHEIRTPINAVLGMNEMIIRESRKSSPAEQSNEELKARLDEIGVYADEIESAGNNLLAIINNILDLSKIEAAKMELVEGEYQLSSLLNDVNYMSSFLAKKKNLSFTVDVDETIPENLYGDKVRIRQIILNILNNAVKYTKEGGIALSVRSEESETEDDKRKICLIISVKDTGIGIRKDDLDKLFSKFQRLDLEQNSTVEGTGLGLAITYNLLKMMDGDIEVESEYGKGSTFTILVPQIVMSDEPVGNIYDKFEDSLEETKTYSVSFTAEDGNILIVDDTRMNLIVCTQLLKDTQIRIDTASSGEEAIGLANKKKYDVILMDQRMPGMDGTEAMHKILEADGLNSWTPIICMTADAVIGAREHYLAEGFTDYLTKPIDSHQLEGMLMKYLPAEKVVNIQNNISEAVKKDDKQDRYSALDKAGINASTGLAYCQNNDALYHSLLEEYVQSYEEKEKNIQNYYDNKDWKNYSTVVHSIKSSSKMIGAADLSDLAAELEKASDEERVSDISADHEKMMKLYKETTEVISSLISDNVKDREKADDEIMEFMPEEME